MGFLANEIRDRISRLLIHQNLIHRQSLLNITKDKSIDLQIRIKAQLEMQKSSRYAFPSNIEKRCIVSGRTRRVINKRSPIAFRNAVVSGLEPGFRPSWW